MAEENRTLVNVLPEHNKLESTDRFLGSGASEEYLVNLDNLASAVFEKIKSEFGAAAFCKVANNDTTTVAGYVVDARAVEKLGKEVDAVNSSLLYENMADVKDGNNFGRNFQIIGTVEKSEKTQRSYFLINADEVDQWKNVPPGLVTTTVSVGIREVFWYSSTICMVRVTEIHPKPGTVYCRTYNNGKWNADGWKVISPT